MARIADRAGRGTEALNATERDFLAASLGRQSRESARRRRRLRVTVGALAAGLVTVSVLAVLAVVQTATANTQRDLAAASSLAAQSRAVQAAQPDLANLLAPWLVRRFPHRDTSSRARHRRTAAR